MRAETAPSPVAAQKPTTPTPAAPPRLWPPVAFVAVYWAAGFVVGRLDKPYFYGFLYGMASGALLALFYFGWWWTRRSVPLRGRLLGFLLVVGGGAVAYPLVHPSLGGFGLLFTGLPIALTAWTAWMLLAKRRSLPLAGAGALAIVWLSWLALALLRIDGLTGELRADLRWRWTPSAEDLARAERAARGEDQSEPVSTAQEPLSAGPGDWVAFRGVDHEGVVRGVTITPDWDSNPPRQVWRRRVGPAWSSLVVVGDRLFTQEQRDDKEAVVCYDAATGKQLWLHEDAARFWEAVSGAGPRATPTFADGRLFTLGATGILNCLDAASGKRHWSRDVTKDAGTKAPGWGFSGSPLVAGGKVVVYGGEGEKNLLAYRVEDGEPAWSADVGKGSYSSPQLVTLGGTPQVLMLADQGLVSVDPASGEVLWRHGANMAGAPRSVQAHVLGDKQVVAGTVNVTGVTRFDVTREGGGWKTAERWTTNEMKPEFPDFVVYQGHAYGFDAGIFCCIELESGTRKWKGGRYGRGQVLLLADQPALLVLTEKGQALLLAADPEKRQELARFQALEGKTWNHPVVVRGRLYARNAEEMACYELAGK